MQISCCIYYHIYLSLLAIFEVSLVLIYSLKTLNKLNVLRQVILHIWYFKLFVVPYYMLCSIFVTLNRKILGRNVPSDYHNSFAFKLFALSNRMWVDTFSFEVLQSLSMRYFRVREVACSNNNKVKLFFRLNFLL